MTAQETFDAIVTHLRRQGQKSMNPETDQCLYRGPDGSKCAIGHVIPDDRYSPSLEGQTAEDDEVAELLIDLGVDLHVAQALQTIHDDYETYEWESEFRDFASYHGFTYTEPAR